MVQFGSLMTSLAHSHGIKARNQAELDQEIEELKEALRIMVTVIDRFGFETWPIFERLEDELALRESIEARMNRWRET